jgi:hypothetical protein
MAKLVGALLSILVHILPADYQWRSWWRPCCLFWFIFCPQTANDEAVGGAAVCFGSYFACRLPMAKLVAALLSVLIRGDENNYIFFRLLVSKLLALLSI